MCGEQIKEGPYTNPLTPKVSATSTMLVGKEHLTFYFYFEVLQIICVAVFPSLSNTLTIFCQTNLCKLLSASQERQIVKAGLSGSRFYSKT